MLASRNDGQDARILVRYGPSTLKAKRKQPGEEGPMTRSLLLCVYAVLVAAGGWGPAARADLLIGAAGPLTGSNAFLGEQLQQGTEAAVAAINAAGGVLGEQLKLVVVDDACDSGQAVAAAEQLAARKVAFVVGHVCSGASIPASEVYEKAGIVQISHQSTNPKLTELGRANVFRVCGRDDQQGVIAGTYLAERWRDKKIAILHDGGVYGQGLAEETRKELNRRGVTEAIFEAFTPGQADYSELIAKLRNAGVEVLYVGSYHQEPALIVREARDSGYDLQLVSGDALATDSFWQIAGPAGEGTLFTFFPDARRSPAAREVVERFRKLGFEPEGGTLYSYGAVQVWAEAAVRAGSAKPEAVIAALRSHEFETVLGPISFDAKGDLTKPGFVWYVWRGGAYAPEE
jgi:branched-chain amino acid transport system substrate-binding protein